MQHMKDDTAQGVTILFSIEDERKKRNRITKRKSRQRKSQHGKPYQYTTPPVEHMLFTNTFTDNCPSCGSLPAMNIEQFQQNTLIPSPESLSMSEFSPFLMHPSISLPGQLSFDAPGSIDYQHHPSLYDIHSIEDTILDDTFLIEDAGGFSRPQSLSDLCTEPSPDQIIDLPPTPPSHQPYRSTSYGFSTYHNSRSEPFHVFQI
ncbi:hypothetical protein PT974_10503 [Cladobotryum mycophilum]|uniref:BZIP domain-containing protein n=1 Tax=Cladobotryum mycophilum TaxID=491253 RepID=A0ABR0SA13_9HYPO